MHVRAGEVVTIIRNALHDALLLARIEALLRRCDMRRGRGRIRIGRRRLDPVARDARQPGASQAGRGWGVPARRERVGVRYRLLEPVTASERNGGA